MEKSIRKIVQIGDASAVTIPPEYLRKQDLERGDEVNLFFSESGVVLIKPILESDVREEVRSLLSSVETVGEVDKGVRS